MPWKLIPPHARKDGKKIEFYYIRGTYLGIRLDHSTGTGDASAARRPLKTWRRQAERGEFRVDKGPEDRPLSFVNAATAYMRAGGDGKFLLRIINA
jgi:hypothetical protein